MIALPLVARALLYIAAGPPEAARIATTARTAMTSAINRTLATIQRGDTLLLPEDRDLVVTEVRPADTAAAVARGRREVISGSWSMTLEPGDVVRVRPRVHVGGGPELDAFGRWEYAMERTL